MALSTDQNDLASCCRLCGGKFGGRLQIETIPDDIARHYGGSYYSYDLRRHKRLKRLRRGLRRRWIMVAPDPMIAFMSLFSSPDPLFRIYRSIGLKLDDRVLDAGTGSGGHVLELKDAGVAGAVGLDPFVEKDVLLDGEILVHQKSLAEMTGKFDLITFHHSLEHMPDQMNALSQARRLLAPGGRVLIQVPTVSSDAFEHYRENWLNLDAPRHFFLHSHRSLGDVASHAGLVIDRLWCDSADVQFMASEQYAKDIPLMDPRSAAVAKRDGIFSHAQRCAYARKATKVNQALRGDKICAVMSSNSGDSNNG
jgi:SAM-dependent methyltransferase